MLKETSLYQGMWIRKISFIFLALVCVVNSVYGQTKTYLKGDVTGNREDVPAVLGAGTVADVTAPLSKHTLLGALRFYYGRNILNDTSTSFAKIISNKTGVSILAAGANSYLQFRNTGNIPMPAGKSVYVKIGTPPTSAGVTVSVSDLLLAGSTSPIDGSLFSGAGSYNTTSSLGAGDENKGSIPSGATFKTELLVDRNSTWYVGIHPLNKAGIFNSAKIKLAVNAGLLSLLDLLDIDLGTTLSMNVHNAFYYSTSGLACSINPIFATRGEVNGISLDLGSVLSGLSLDTIISSPQAAIDSNNTTFCSFRSGLLSLGALSTVSQSYLFDHTTTAGDGLRLQMSFPSSTLTVALLNNVTVSFYRNDTLRSTDTLGKRMLGVDLLTLPLVSGSFRSIDAVLRSTSTFDRATLNLGGGILSVSLAGSSIRVHEVSIAPAAPTITTQPANQNICKGQIANFSVTSSAGASYQWQSFSGSSWGDISGATSATYTPIVLPAMDSTFYRVRVIAGPAGCRQSIASNQALLRVKSPPSIPAVTIGP